MKKEVPEQLNTVLFFLLFRSDFGLKFCKRAELSFPGRQVPGRRRALSPTGIQRKARGSAIRERTRQRMPRPARSSWIIPQCTVGLFANPKTNLEESSGSLMSVANKRQMVGRPYRQRRAEHCRKNDLEHFFFVAARTTT